MLSKTLALFGLASAASAHIVMTNPVPYGNPNNSPLDASGSDFPCKAIAPSGGAGENVYQAGSTQQLAFMGTAVHGGGSCQVSVTTDLNPTRDSKWKVIKSIEGGCPAQDQAGNMGNSATAEVPYKYNFDIPEEMPEGEYVLAWTWFNKVGNREMYMNCASVQIEGGSGDEAFLETLPDMLVANIGGECGTVDSTDVEFPDPGNALDRMNGATKAFAAPTGSCGPKGADPAPQPTVPEPTTAPEAPADSPAPQPTPPASTPSVPGGVFMPVPSDEPADAPEPEQPATEPEEPATEPEQPVTEPETPEAPEVPETKPETPTGGAPSGGFAVGTACTSEGAWNCVGGSSFQRCASGFWSGMMGMASGMTCVDGQSAQLNIQAAKTKRVLRRAQRIPN